ncbi:MAG: hypothetical protein JWO53_498 [Chlamydiia bacterium]|nr:hypothetical protein [Chlamydiia bacterium]
MKKYLFLVLLGFLLFPCGHSYADTTTRDPSYIASIRKHYFSNLFLYEGFGYTLLGARAMSADWWFATTPFSNILSKTIFKSDKFIFKETKGLRHSRSIIFIHKQKFKEVFSENRDLFYEVLGPQITAESLLQEIEESSDYFWKILDYDQTLLGILLGYGRENALLFRRRNEVKLERPDYRPPHPGVFYIHLQLDEKPNVSLEPDIMIEPSPQFATIAEERKWLDEHFNFAVERRKFKRVELIQPVVFHARKSPETDALINKYFLCQEILTEMFSEKDTEKVVFEQLTAKEPISFDERLQAEVKVAKHPE